VPGTPKHNLPYPVDTNVADVPSDLRNLATQTENVLNTRFYDRNELAGVYQSKIKVLNILPATGTDGDVVFLVT
jgi:hypothetical protein